MERYKRVDMKDMLAQSLYELMKKTPFEKITIKQITTKTGVIRGTFYNHFYDKYEALEYLTYLLLVKENRKDETDFLNLLYHILVSIEKEKTFLVKCFMIEGQNSFDEMVSTIFKDLFKEYVRKNYLQSKEMDMELLIGINTCVFVFLMKEWILKNKHYHSDDVYSIFKVYFTKSSAEILRERHS